MQPEKPKWTGSGSDWAMVGVLILSQMLTLFTTPVVYLYLDRLQSWLRGERHRQSENRMLTAAE